MEQVSISKKELAKFLDNNPDSPAAVSIKQQLKGAISAGETMSIDAKQLVVGGVAPAGETPIVKAQLADDSGSAVMPTSVLAKRVIDTPDIDGKVELIKVFYLELESICISGLTIAIRIGDLLVSIKQSMEFGDFGKWFENSTLTFKHRTAQNYMLLYDHRDELLDKGITGIVEAYAAMRGEPAPCEFINADDGIRTEGKSIIAHTINLDAKPKLPKKKADGSTIALSIDEKTLAAIRAQTGWWKDTWSTYIKLVVVLPIYPDQMELVADFIIVAQKLLQPGGKLIFHRPVPKKEKPAGNRPTPRRKKRRSEKV